MGKKESEKGKVPALVIQQPWAYLVTHGFVKLLTAHVWWSHRGLLWVYAHGVDEFAMGYYKSKRSMRTFKITDHMDMREGAFVGAGIMKGSISMLSYRDPNRWEATRAQHMRIGKFPGASAKWGLQITGMFFEVPVRGEGHKSRIFYPTVEEEAVMLDEVGDFAWQ